MSKPFSQACENNKRFILDIIRHEFAPGSRVLEIGTGTAQHITFFAEELPEIQWQPSDMPDNLPTMLAGLADCSLPNVAAPLALDVAHEPWPVGAVDGIFSSNTLHIMPYAHVERFLQGAGRSVRGGGKLCVYGAFKYAGEFTTASNAEFDAWLRQRNPLSGIRDIEQVKAWAEREGFRFVADHALPANNQLLVWEKVPTR